MAYVVTDACINCKHTDCVEVCPVDCFYEGPNFVVIHPDECIDCGDCVSKCPENAIMQDFELPDEKKDLLLLNEELAEKWSQITSKKAPLPQAVKWSAVKNKLQYLMK